MIFINPKAKSCLQISVHCMQRSVSVSLYDTNKLMTREEAEERGIGNGTVDLQNKIKISYML